MIVFGASTIVSAALKPGSLPEQALLHAAEVDLFALSAAVDAEIAEVLARPKFVRMLSPQRRNRMLDILRAEAVWFDPPDDVSDCRDPKDDKYLALALAARAAIIVSGDYDLLVLHPWRGIRILLPAEYLLLSSHGR